MTNFDVNALANAFQRGAISGFVAGMVIWFTAWGMKYIVKTFRGII